MRVSSADSKRIGTAVGVDWTRIDPDQFQRGFEVEFGLRTGSGMLNATYDAIIVTGNAVWSNLTEFPDYYSRQDALASEADSGWVPIR